MSVAVAIAAVCKCDRLLEIAARVALRALDRGVFSEQGESGFGMIELLGGRNLFPAGGRVAHFA